MYFNYPGCKAFGRLSPVFASLNRRDALTAKIVIDVMDAIDMIDVIDMIDARGVSDIS